MLEGELDASSGCLEGPLSVIIEVVEFQAAGCGVQGKFKCSSGPVNKMAKRKGAVGIRT